jgi:hypothetical protein
LQLPEKKYHAFQGLVLLCLGFTQIPYSEIFTIFVDSSQTLILMGGTGCSLLQRSIRAVGVSPAQQYLGEMGGVAKLDLAMNPTGGLKVSVHNCGAIPGLQIFGAVWFKPL